MTHKRSQVYQDHRFEVMLGVAMVLLGLGSIAAQQTTSTALDSQISVYLYYVWQWGASLSGAAIIAALFTRPWAARRMPPARGERTMATLRGVEAAACFVMASAMFAYVAVLFSISITSTAVPSSAFLTLSVAFIGRARELIKENKDRLAQLHLANASSK